MFVQRNVHRCSVQQGCCDIKYSRYYGIWKLIYWSRVLKSKLTLSIYLKYQVYLRNSVFSAQIIGNFWSFWLIYNCLIPCYNIFMKPWKSVLPSAHILHQTPWEKYLSASCPQRLILWPSNQHESKEKVQKHETKYWKQTDCGCNWNVNGIN